MSKNIPDRHKMTSFIQEELGALLRATREDKGISIAQAAEMLGTTEEEIIKIEKNIGLIPLSLIQRYADVLGKKLQLKFL
ncbi:MAG: helix-turn-helix domain-containing protein [Deferribacteres bacterium]|nr:helix-turn-helix domain-containing protein [candidate division KSB1 bacterium]MCB9500505.1 helix-turn-helix domain-containing protein [Deferribacteres bacterium]